MYTYTEYKSLESSAAIHCVRVLHHDSYAVYAYPSQKSLKRNNNDADENDDDNNNENKPGKRKENEV